MAIADVRLQVNIEEDIVIAKKSTRICPEGIFVAICHEYDAAQVAGHNERQNTNVRRSFRHDVRVQADNHRE